jgi:hypothetical protein
MTSPTARGFAACLVLLALIGLVGCGSSEKGATSAQGAVVAKDPAVANGTNGSSGAAGSGGAAGAETGIGGTADAAAGPPWTAPTRGGRYLVTIRPEHGRLRIGALDPWLVQVTSRTGAPVHPLQIFFDGGMPQHRHGFESKPRVTDDLGGGLIRVDGVRFQMAGAWLIRVDVAAAEGADVALFALEVGP